MGRAVTDEFYIMILPVDNEVMKTYALLEINEREEHYGPSDHIIISHAMTNRLPLISSTRNFRFYERQGLGLIYNGKQLSHAHLHAES